MEQKYRGLLAYLFGWIAGLIILFGLKDNDKRTKFNACQSIVISGVNMIASFVLGFIPFVRYFSFVISGLALVLSVIGMIKAYKEEDFEIPFISDLTRDIFKNQLGE